MEKLGVRIIYLYNSGFLMETSTHLLVFDFYKDVEGTRDSAISMEGILEEASKAGKEVAVFVSHSHGDHYNPAIFQWANMGLNIKYFLSNDVSAAKRKGEIYTLATYEDMKFEDMYIKAYGSTDQGISFLIKVDGVTVFHAGDLNWWDWWDETREENEKAARWFKEELEKLEGEAIDIAFFPVDSRLKDKFYLGGDYFINKLEPKVFVPMHFREDYKITNEFAKREKYPSTKVIEITHRGEEILL